jgi:hypothetical protein
MYELYEENSFQPDMIQSGKFQFAMKQGMGLSEWTVTCGTSCVLPPVGQENLLSFQACHKQSTGAAQIHNWGRRNFQPATKTLKYVFIEQHFFLLASAFSLVGQ